MTELNLIANTPEQEKIKSYLEANASEMLALKINTGTKTLDSFMKYACDEAKKIAANGANYACIDDNTVFSWAIHYFEEDSIDKEPQKVIKEQKPIKRITERYETISLDIEPLCEPKPIVNIETGELIDSPSFDNEIIMKLYGIFGDELEGC